VIRFNGFTRCCKCGEENENRLRIIVINDNNDIPAIFNAKDRTRYYSKHSQLFRQAQEELDRADELLQQAYEAEIQCTLKALDPFLIPPLAHLVASYVNHTHP
jgi:hypothetical protein